MTRRSMGKASAGWGKACGSPQSPCGFCQLGLKRSQRQAFILATFDLLRCPLSGGYAGGMVDEWGRAVVRGGTGDHFPRVASGNVGSWYRKATGRHHSTIAREINRYGGAVNYRALAAQERYESFTVRPKEHKLVASSRLHGVVNEGLEQKWSPEQISARLTENYPDDPEMRVSHETLYQTLYLQAKGELRTELKLALGQGRAKRVSRYRASVSRGKIPDMVNISERPAEAEDRAVPGFWEGDLIIGKAGKSQIATLVERTTRFTMLVRIPYDRSRRSRRRAIG